MEWISFASTQHALLCIIRIIPSVVLKALLSHLKLKAEGFAIVVCLITKRANYVCASMCVFACGVRACVCVCLMCVVLFVASK